MEKKFIEHRPGYFTGFENKEYVVNTFDEVLEIPFVKNFSQSKGFYSYAVDVSRKSHDDYKLTLMAMFDWDEEYNGCRTWWVVGYLPGFVKYQTNLNDWKDIKASHKPNCWIRKYDSCKDILGIDRDSNVKMKIVKELGWPKDDMFGIAVHCDCGWEKAR